MSGLPPFRIRQRRERMGHPKFCDDSKGGPPAVTFFAGEMIFSGVEII